MIAAGLEQQYRSNVLPADVNVQSGLGHSTMDNRTTSMFCGAAPFEDFEILLTPKAEERRKGLST